MKESIMARKAQEAKRAPKKEPKKKKGKGAFKKG
jgi:hypothetical protein